jgi:hypothetical protein
MIGQKYRKYYVIEGYFLPSLAPHLKARHTAACIMSQDEIVLFS